MSPSDPQTAGLKSPTLRSTALPVARLRMRSVGVTVAPQVSWLSGMVMYASALPLGANTASPATLVPERLSLCVMTPCDAMWMATVAPDVALSKQTVSAPGPTLLSGHALSSVSAVTTSVDGLMIPESADCICMSNEPHPQPPVSTRANVIPSAVQPTR